MDRPDAIVVGAGPNGLAAAVTLAREGLRVQVLERAEEPGGAVRSSRDVTLPDVLHDLGAAVFPLAAASPVLARWPLEAHGLRWIRSPLPLAHPLEGRRAAVLADSLEGTVHDLGDAGERWRALTGPATERWDVLAPDLFGPPLRVPGAPAAVARFGARALLPASWVAAALGDRRAGALWAGLAAHAALPLGMAGTSISALVLAAAGQRVGWPFPEGGAGRLTGALSSYLRALGGEIALGTEIRDLGEVPSARVVLLDVTPAQLRRLAAGRLPDGYDRALRRYRSGEAVVKVDLAVEGGLPWTDPACADAGTVHLGGEWREIASAEAAVTRGRLPAHPYVLVAQPGRFDRTRVHDGLEPVWAYAHLPRAMAGDERAVRALADAALTQLERAAPGARARTRAARIWGPPELAEVSPNLAGGDIAAGAATPWQLLARPVLSATPYATPLAGIYLCSAATPPGPGVHGMSGFRAAQLALWRDFGIRCRIPQPPLSGR